MEKIEEGKRIKTLLINRRQGKNPILSYVKNVQKTFSDIIPDFVVGKKTCVLFLSLRYHKEKRRYIRQRLGEVPRAFDLTVLLCLVDVKPSDDLLQELMVMCAVEYKATLITCWSKTEAARYLESLLVYEFRSPEAIAGHFDDDSFLGKVSRVLSHVKSVNSTDVVTLMAAFGSLHRMAMATQEEIAQCKGIGPKKANELFQWLHRPFHRRSDPTEKKGGEQDIAIYFSQSAKGSQPTMEEDTGKEEKPEKELEKADGSL